MVVQSKTYIHTLLENFLGRPRISGVIIIEKATVEIDGQGRGWMNCVNKTVPAGQNRPSKKMSRGLEKGKFHVQAGAITRMSCI